MIPVVMSIYSPSQFSREVLKEDFRNGLKGEQAFIYIVMIRKTDGITVELDGQTSLTIFCNQHMLKRDDSLPN
jgi:hypothetical protein